MMTVLTSRSAPSGRPGDDRLTPIVGLTRDELAAAMARAGVADRQRRMRASQVWRWIYHRGLARFDAMTDIAKDLRGELARHFTVDRLEIVTEQVSSDGTRKWLLRLAPDADGRRQEIETVYIPEEDRGTLCISSQVGCTLTCTFCHTGTQRLVRNLTAGEIVGQILTARDRLEEWPHQLAASPHPPAGGRYITNVVLMGMGEPLYNFESVKAAVQIAADGEGIALSRRRITLSTSGVVPQIVRAGAEIGAMLAVSLHATTDAVRDKLVPLNRKYPIAELLAACRAYPGLSNARRITFEYVMLKDVNDSLADARRLVQLLRGIPAKVNLIPFNPWPGSPFACSDWDRHRKVRRDFEQGGLREPGAHAARPRHHGRLRPAQVRIRAADRPAADGSRAGD